MVWVSLFPLWLPLSIVEERQISRLKQIKGLLPSRIVIWSVKSYSPRFLFFRVEQNYWATMSSLSLQPDALYQFCISVAMRIAIQLLWFLLIDCMFWEVSYRCAKQIPYQEAEVCQIQRYMSSGKYLRPPQKKGGKNPTAARFCECLAFFRYPHAYFFPPLKTDFWTVKEKEKSWKSCHYVYSFWIFSFRSGISVPFQICVSFLVTCSWNVRIYSHWLVIITYQFQWVK